MAVERAREKERDRERDIEREKDKEKIENVRQGKNVRHRLIEIMIEKAKNRDRGIDSRRETYGKRHGRERKLRTKIE